MNKLSMIQWGFLACLLVLFAACNSDDDPRDDFLNGDLKIEILDQYTSNPAKVSIFFKVDEKDGAPVAGLTENNFTIYEKGRNDMDFDSISAFEAERKISAKGQIFLHNTLLVLDLSGSVTNNSLAELKDAAKAFIDETMPMDASDVYSMSIYWFDGSDSLYQLVADTRDNTVLKAGIDNLNAGMSNDNSTDLYGAVLKSQVVAEDRIAYFQQQDIIHAVSVVVFTDGTDRAGRHAKDDALNAVRSASTGISYFTIGLGAEIDQPVLEEIGSAGHVFASDRNELTVKFREIAGLVWAEANSYYLFEYCTPKRDGSGVNELRLEVRKDNKKGAEDTSFDATGFGGGCSL